MSRISSPLRSALIRRISSSGRALAFVLAALPWVTPALAAEKAPKFQPLPKDESLQPLPPKNMGLIDFEGNHAYTTDQLRIPLAEQISDIQKQGLTRPRADDTAYYLSVYYRKQGYANAEVKWNIDGSRLILTISEGARTYLRHVTFVGNKTNDHATLFQYLIGGTEERLLKKPAEFPFVESDVQGGVSRIRGLYESQGYLDALVDDAVMSYSGDHTRADVLVKIKEGPQYTFGKIRFVGDPIFGRDDLLGALGDAGPKKAEPKATPAAKPYTTQEVNAMQRNLQYFYKERGYYTAEVLGHGEPAQATPLSRNHREVPVTFTIKAGPIFRFDGATVKGLTKLRPSVVTQRFKKLTGKVYAPEDLDEHFRELLRTGLFSNLRVSTVPLPDHTVRIDLTAEEAKPKEAGFSVGYGSYDGFVLGVRLGDRDLFGYGRPLSLEAEYSQRGLRSNLVFSDPWLLDTDVSFRARIFIQSRDEIGYSKTDEGIRLEFTGKPTKKIELGAFLQAKNVEVTTSAIVPSYLGPTAYQIASFGLTQSFDYRDSPVSVTKGWIFTSAADFNTIAGSAAFARGNVRLSGYIPIGEHLLLALGARAGAIYPFSIVPIDERYFNGGGSTVRSFAERELGPIDPHHYPIGGDVFTVFNAELNFPLSGALVGAVFVDAGNVVTEFKNAGLQNMRYGIGVGLRYKLPIGPIRLDVGLNPDPQQYESWGAVNFSFGFAF